MSLLVSQTDSHLQFGIICLYWRYLRTYQNYIHRLINILSITYSMQLHDPWPELLTLMRPCSEAVKVSFSTCDLAWEKWAYVYTKNDHFLAFKVLNFVIKHSITMTFLVLVQQTMSYSMQFTELYSFYWRWDE